jgi:hypothetical protein
VVIHGDFAIVLGENQTTSAEVADAVREKLDNENVTTMLVRQSGADGRSTLIEYTALLPKNDFQARLRSMLRKSA